MIRRILPKGVSFDNLTQEDINIMMSNINSYKRKKLNDSSPIELFNLMYGKNISSMLNIEMINSNDVNLSYNLFDNNNISTGLLFTSFAEKK